MRKIILFINLGFLSLMIVTGLLPEFPDSIESAIIKYECADPEPCTISGTLDKSWIGEYTMHIDDEKYFQSSSEHLASVDDNIYTFDKGYFRQYPVIVVRTESD